MSTTSCSKAQPADWSNVSCTLFAHGETGRQAACCDRQAFLTLTQQNSTSSRHMILNNILTQEGLLWGSPPSSERSTTGPCCWPGDPQMTASSGRICRSYKPASSIPNWRNFTPIHTTSFEKIPPEGDTYQRPCQCNLVSEGAVVDRLLHALCDVGEVV